MLLVVCCHSFFPGKADLDSVRPSVQDVSLQNCGLELVTVDHVLVSQHVVVRHLQVLHRRNVHSLRHIRLKMSLKRILKQLKHTFTIFFTVFLNKLVKDEPELLRLYRGTRSTEFYK